MSIELIYSTNSLTIEIPITDEETGGPMDLTGATIYARAEIKGRVIEATTSIDGNSVLVSFAAGSFDGLSGIATLQVDGTIGSEVQTPVVETFPVGRSI